jgi:hypothetical protein
VTGWEVGCLLRRGVVLVTKIPLHPESSIVMGGEGPSVASNLLTSLMTFKLLLLVLGVPLTQELVLGVLFSRPRLLRCPPWGMLRVLLPPIVLWMVASVWWPSAGNLQCLL